MRKLLSLYPFSNCFQVYTTIENEQLYGSVLKKHKNDSNGLLSLYTPKNFYRVIFSAYSDQNSTRVESIGNAQVLHIGVSPEEVRLLKSSRAGIIDSIEDAKSKHSESSREASDLKRKVMEIQQQLSVVKNKKTQLESLERQMNRHKENAKVIKQRKFQTDEEIQEELKEKVAKNGSKQMSLLRKFVVNELHFKLYSYSVSGSYSTMDQNFKRKRYAFFRCCSFEGENPYN
jgi:predicted ribosome quality control (RQC) complex YloA/Tae2 family protein